MDVEAQDDGKLAKIVLGDGTKDVKVGETIAFIADPEDDLATLKIPEVVSGGKSSTQGTQPVTEVKKSESEDKVATRATNGAKVQQREANKDQTLLPSVQVLLGENGISREDALAKIPATGPNGRLLKGDVLAYLGKVPNEAVVGIAEYVESSEHLDLSNIQLMKQTQQQQQQSAPAAPAASLDKPAKPVEPSETGKPASTEAVAAQPEKAGPTTISEELYFSVGQSIPYGRLLASIDSLMKEAFHYTHKMPLNAEIQSDYFDPVFEDLLVMEPHAPRFEYTYELIPAGPIAVGGGPAMNGCSMRRGQGAGCSMHGGQGNCEHHAQVSCSMHGGQGNCGHHAQAGCNMHSGQGNCGHHGQAGCRHHGKAAGGSRGYILNLEIKLNDRFADAKGKAERFVSYLEQLELP